MKTNKKISVLIPPYFWSSVPYDGLILFDYLKRFMDVDLIMFEEDIRLNKIFNGNEKFYFDTNAFSSMVGKTVKNWIDFYKLAMEYSYVLCGVHMMPKNNRKLMMPIPDSVKNKIILTDIGGLDILTGEGLNQANTFMVKGNIWEKWMRSMKINNVYATGCPQYDYYLHSDKITLPQARIISEQDFFKKYAIPSNKKILMIAPSNPASHKNHFDENIKELKNIECYAKKYDFQIIIKTYPQDYVFYEKENDYNGISKRTYQIDSPQYEFIKKEIHTAIIIESQDHFSALISADILFNMSGSHIAWETYFTKTQSFSMNYCKQKYYGKTSYLPEYINLPDSINIEICDAEEMFLGKTIDKEFMSDYISRDFSLTNIKNKVFEVL